MNLWRYRLVWCAYCHRVVRWRRGAHLADHPLPPDVVRQP